MIVVLSMLVLLSGLLVAFLTTARTERTAAAADSATAASRQIADSTISFVISQVRDATTIANNNTTWASQPGAIRTFSGTLNGKRPTLKEGAYYDGYGPGGDDAVFKLYSSDRMRVSSKQYATEELPEETTVIEGWDRTSPTDGFVDLNEPSLSLRRDLNKDGDIVEPRYPIIDPRARYNKNNSDLGLTEAIVEGFDAKISKDQVFKLPGGGEVPYVPMPVKWLYVLQDGTIGPASLGTESNPIVGRTAFWTDDESCKLNINTASEGTFWDTPTASSAQECGAYQKQATEIPASAFGLNLAGSQPIKAEYQRYPGHPATTCLSPVLGWLWDVRHSSPATPVYPYVGSQPNKVYNTFKEAMYQMAAFTPYDRGTSRGAMYNTDVTASSDGSLKVRTKHLYTSVDELLFKAKRFTGTVGNGGDPEINDKLTPEALEKSRFFLTANSRAPEINLLGRPRVTIWPVNADYRYRTAHDDLFLFTSTISRNLSGDDKKFCLLRGDAKSGINDFLGTWKSGTNDQNVKMFEYLQYLTSQPVPAFGKTFADNQKFGGSEGRDEMLILIFDYIRTVNLTDTGTTTRTANVFAPYTPRFFTKETTPNNQYTRYDRSVEWSGQVTPLHRVPVPRPNMPQDELQGLGRFVLPTEVAIVFHGLPAQGAKKLMQATLVMEMSTVMPGFPGIRETYWTRITPTRPALIKFGSGETFAIDLCGKAYPENDTLMHRRGVFNICNVSSHEVAQGRSYLPTLGFATAFHYFKEFSGYTSMQDLHQRDPVRPASPDMKPYAKVFDNSRPESRYQNNENGIGYVRSRTAKDAAADGTGGDGTIAYYPYVSNKIDVTGQTTFTIVDLGEYKIDIYVGEGPDDPRSTLGVGGPLPGEPVDMPPARPVQTATVRFPDNAPIVGLTVPTTAPMYSRPQSGDRIENPRNFIIDGDIVRSMELTCLPNPKAATYNQAGDLRLAAARSVLPRQWWEPTDTLSKYQGSGNKSLHRLTRGHADPDPGYTYLNNAGMGNFAVNAGMRTNKPPILPYTVKAVQRVDGGPGDFDRGLSKHMDGAFGNKVDEGNLKFDSSLSDYTGMPYFRGRGMEETGQTFFSPNRQLSSPVMFGSLPTGVRVDPFGNKPWQTLLFRPNREINTTHPGADLQLGPPDHLLLDLFHLPVIEPYAISEPFSTAGKVNLNYVIAPFGYARGEGGNNPGTSNPRSYLRRDTGLRGVLKSTFIMAVPTSQGDGAHTENPQTQPTPFRFPIDRNRTIEAMETRLKSSDGQFPLFRSASEICTVDLYPEGVSGGIGASWANFWSSKALTGDNMRERPYSHIYPRVTTKSNVYTVHMRCQTIRKAKGSPANQFDPDKDTVLGEYRGSATIERFIDPNDKALLDYKEKEQKVDQYYRYRVINTKQFSSR